MRRKLIIVAITCVLSLSCVAGLLGPPMVELTVESKTTPDLHDVTLVLGKASVEFGIVGSNAIKIYADYPLRHPVGKTMEVRFREAPGRLVGMTPTNYSAGKSGEFIFRISNTNTLEILFKPKKR